MKSSEVVPTNGSGHGALAGFLRERGVEVLICGGIGAGAQNALAEAGIKLYGGVSGSADSAVQALIEGNLSEPLTFKRYPKSDMYLIQLRDRVNREIKELTAERK